MDDDTTTTTTAPRPRPSALAVVALTLIVVLALVAGLAGIVWGRSGHRHLATVTVSASGVVRGAPDTLSFDLGVQTTGASATAALDANDARMRALIAALERGGLARGDWQTSSVSLYPVTDQRGAVTGFSASNTLTVTTHRLGRAGAVIDAAVHAVGNGVQIGGVTFSISNQSRLLAAARERAMANAHAAATQLATGGGVHLGAIESVTSVENSTPVVYPAYDVARASGSVPIEPGNQSLTVQVTVVYALT